MDVPTGLERSPGRGRLLCGFGDDTDRSVDVVIKTQGRTRAAGASINQYIQPFWFGTHREDDRRPLSG